MIYTKNGDQGRSSVIKGFPTSKDAPVFEVLGTVDELSSSLGVAKYEAYAFVRDTIALVQQELVAVGTAVAGGSPFDYPKSTAHFEAIIDALEKKNIKFQGFTLSGETKLGALLDQSRAIARRLERNAATLVKTYRLTKEASPYFNRLSDLLYVLARYADRMDQKPEEASLPPAAEHAKPGGRLTAEDAVWLCQKVLEKARSQEMRAVCCVCNQDGNVVALIRDDDSFMISVEVAQNKAWTAASLKMSTKEAQALSEQKDGLYGLQYMNTPKLMLLPGGVPLFKGGALVGGFGVSGGMAWQDEELACYAKILFERGEGR